MIAAIGTNSKLFRFITKKNHVPRLYSKSVSTVFLCVLSMAPFIPIGKPHFMEASSDPEEYGWPISINEDVVCKYTMRRMFYMGRTA